MTDAEGNQTTTLEDKKEMVRKAAFSHSSADPVGPPQSHLGMPHNIMDKNAVHRVLYDQVQTKSPVLDHINL